LTVAAREAIERVIGLIDRLPSRANDVAAAVATAGEAGAAAALKVLAFDLRKDVTEGLRKIVAYQNASCQWAR